MNQIVILALIAILQKEVILLQAELPTSTIQIVSTNSIVTSSIPMKSAIPLCPWGESHAMRGGCFPDLTQSND
jgi:hypothetical protein